MIRFSLFAILALTGCLEDPPPITKTVGDRNITVVTGGKLRSGDENGRYYYVIRGLDTGAEYLAIIDAGIIRLETKPKLTVESPK